MAFLDIKNVAIRGISACVPSQVENISDIYKWEGASNFISSTGIKQRRRASESITAADLCEEAGNKLIESLCWDKNEIKALIFVSQTPDYILPSSSSLLQDRLCLPNDCLTLDISLGCSGWVYALSVITALMQNGTIKKGLLLAGDTITRLCNPEDKSTFPLFGDAGTATAIEYNEKSEGMKFLLNSDGSGYESIICREGGFRSPFSSQTLTPVQVNDQITRRGCDMQLEGMDVFSFGISKAPKSVKQLCLHFEINQDFVDIFAFHQANLMMNENIRKKLKISPQKVPYSLADFGNTSCSSIPLTLVSTERDKLISRELSIIACGFGVGLSWGSVYFKTDHIIVPELVEL